MANYDFTYTGAEIQAILDTAKKLKDSGYIFLGVATPSTNPGTPTQKVYYEASQAGTYTNFGGAVLPDGISLLIWNGSWTSETVMYLADDPTAESENPVKSGGVVNYVKELVFHGQDSTFIVHKIPVQAGEKYYIVPSKTTWSVPYNTSSGNLNAYYIYPNDDTSTYYYRVRIPSHTSELTSPVSPYMLTVPEGVDHISIGIRASAGVTLNIKFFHMDLYQPMFNEMRSAENELDISFFPGYNTYDGKTLTFFEGYPSVIIQAKLSRHYIFTNAGYSFSNGEDNYRVYYIEPSILNGNPIEVASWSDIVSYQDFNSTSRFTQIKDKYFFAVFNKKSGLVGGLIMPYIKNLSDISYDSGGLITPVLSTWKNGKYVDSEGVYSDSTDWWMVDVDMKKGETISCHVAGTGASVAISYISIKNGEGDYSPILVDIIDADGRIVEYTAVSDCVIGICSCTYQNILYTPVIKTSDVYKPFPCEYTLEGNGNNPVYFLQLGDKLIPGHTYCIYPDKTTWECDTNPSTGNIYAFVVFYYTSFPDFKVLYGRKIASGENTFIPLDGSISLTIPDNATAINILFRASSGTNLTLDVREIGSIGDNTILELNPIKDYLPRVATLKRKTPYGSGSGSRVNTPLVLGWFSDNHGTTDNFRRIIEWKKEYNNYIDDVINCGDTILNTLKTYANDIDPYFEEGGDKVLLALGNHDVATPDSPYKGWDGTQSFVDIFQKYVGRIDAQETGIVLPQYAAVNGYSFYYKDYDGLGKVRLIVVDSAIKTSDIGSSGSGAPTAPTEAYNAAQKSWFEGVLEDARLNGYSVVCASHFGTPITEITTSSGFSQDYDLADTTHNKMQPYLLEAVDDFIDNGGEFIAWLVGHAHIDKIGTSKDNPNQLMIRITTSSYRTDYLYGQLPSRIVGTKTQDAFNIVEIDTYYKEIRMLRVGTNFDTMGRPLDLITIDYANKVVKE